MNSFEKSLEQRTVRLIEAQGGKAFKWVAPGHAGVPDRICIMPGGRIIFIELKRQKSGRESPLQKRVSELLLSLGCTVWLIRDFEELKALLREDGYEV